MTIAPAPPRSAPWDRRPSMLVLAGGVFSVLAASAFFWRDFGGDRALTVAVTRGTLAMQLTVSGTLKPAQASGYRSPLGGRETEITFLVAEGTHVGEGDLLVRLDTTDVQRELERTIQESRQIQIELQVAEIEHQSAQATVDSLVEGEGALNVKEAQAKLAAIQKKVDRLTAEFNAMKPLFEKGYITREELSRTSATLEVAQDELALEKQRATVLVEQTHPREEQRARLSLAQKAAQRENVRTRQVEVDARLKLLRAQIEACTIYAQRPGLVVHEDFLASSPRRKVRLGDRVTGSQALVTIPEVAKMVLHASTSEADVHRLQPGQKASIRLEAFPDLRLTGTLSRVGTLAASSERPRDDKRFDLLIDLDPSTAELRPEMTARADIDLGERPNVLLVPINAIFERNGQTVCHVAGRLRMETRPVQLGGSNAHQVEVLSGLIEGERVSLVDSTGTTLSETGGDAGGGSKTPATDRTRGKALAPGNAGR